MYVFMYICMYVCVCVCVCVYLFIYLFIYLLFDRNRSQSGFDRQISGQFSIELSHIISWRFYLVFA